LLSLSWRGWLSLVVLLGQRLSILKSGASFTDVCESQVVPLNPSGDCSIGQPRRTSRWNHRLIPQCGVEGWKFSVLTM